MNTPHLLKLRIVPASQGVQWVRLGVVTFLKQPWLISGIFFLFLLLISLVSQFPLVGSAISCFLLPMITLGFMALSKEVSSSNVGISVTALRVFFAEYKKFRSMAVLGSLYMLGFSIALAFSVLVDGGNFASFYLLDSSPRPELLHAKDFQSAALLTAILSLPLSFLFWHAPALVHWHDVTPIKSIFFSLVACWRNLAAFTVYGLTWGVILLIGSVIVIAITTLANRPEFASTLLLPGYMLISSAIFASLYFSFRDCFEET